MSEEVGWEYERNNRILRQQQAAVAALAECERDEDGRWWLAGVIEAALCLYVDCC